MRITEFFKKQMDVFVSIDTEGAWRRDAGPFVSFDTNVPKVMPLSDGPTFEIFERDINRIPAKKAKIVEKTEMAKEVKINWEFDVPETLLLAAPKAQKLLMAGKQPLLLGMPEVIKEALDEILEAQHVIYFSDIEMRDGAEMVTEDKIVREKHHNFLAAKVASLVFMMVGLASILFPSISLKAAKMEYTVNPTNTTPGLSFAISSNDMTVATDPVTSEQTGSLSVATRENTLVTSALGLDVSTTGANGYKLYVTTSGTDKKGAYTNALVDKSINANNGEGAKINTLSSDTTMSAFPAGRWGYATDSSLQSNTLFKAFPVYDSTDTIKYGGDEIASANTAVADADAAGETPFTIGIKTDSSLPAGSYENELLFTVIANPVMLTYNLNFDGNTTDSSLAGMPATVTEASSDVFKDITIPAGKPTRDDYVFVGWAESANGSAIYNPGDDVTLQVADINVSQTINKTLYAVWEDKAYLQDFDAENELINTGDSKTLYDRRDGESYTVKRLPDGKVWMTQNLRYATGAYVVSSNTEYGGYYNWGTALNVCPTGWHLPTTAEQVALDVAYGFSGEARTDATDDINNYKRTDGNWPGYVTAGYYNDSTSALASVDIALTYWSSTPDSSNSNKAWYITTDGATGTQFQPSYSNRKALGFSVRCAAGEEQKKYLQDFNDAIDLRTVGDSDTYYDKRDGAEYTVKRLPDGKVWMTQNLRYMGTDSDPGTTPVTSGSFTTPEGSKVVGTSITVSTSAIYSTSQTGAYYYGNTSYGAYYDWTAAHAVCPAGWHLPSSSESNALDSAYGYAGRNRDSSGSTHGSVYQSYASIESEISNYTSTSGNWPGYTPNGELYQGNLTGAGDTMLLWLSDGDGYNSNAFIHYNRSGSSRRLFYTNYNDMLVKTYGDFGVGVRCVGDQPNVFYIQDFDENTMLPNYGDSATLTDKRDQKTYTVKRLKDGEVWMTQNLAYEADAKAVSSTYGGYYLWDIAQSVCPTGWHLPSNSTTGEYGKFSTAYGATFTTNSNGQVYATNLYSKIVGTSTDTNFLIGGLYQVDGTSPTNVGTVGAYWTTTEHQNGEYGGNYWISSSGGSTAVYVTDWSSKGRALSVRCLADKDARVSFDANGGTGTMSMQSFTKGVRQNISTNTFTRDGYDFAGWALTPDATAAKYTDAQPAVFNKATTLYAVWEANYMQDFDAKTQIPNTGDSVTLVDQRDGELYTAKRLPDGKVWMTQNLRYATGAYTVSSNTEYGGYYNWDTALNICPSGWHLPIGGDNGEFSKLDVAYGYSGQNRTDTGAAANYELSTGNWPGLVTAGYYYNGSLRSNVGIYWSQTVYNSTNAYNMLIDSRINPVDYGGSGINMSVRCIANEQETVSFDANGASGTMADVMVEKGQNVTLTNGFTNPAYTFDGWATSADGAVVYTDGQVISVNEDIALYAIWTPKGDFIQDFDQDTELLTADSTKTLYDKRDGKTYTVKRLADGKVWMTQNLSLGDASESITLTNEDSAINGSSWTLPAQTSGAFSTANYNTVNYRVNSTYGNYYNWYTATAGTGTSSMTSGDATGSICPKGWHLPTGGTNGETAQLYSAYNNNANSLIAAFTPKYAGYNNSTSSNDVYYMTSTVADADNPYVLHMYSGYVNPNNSLRVYKYYGFSVRCVADYEEKTVSFNANGGTGAMASQTIVKGQSLTLPTNTMTRTNYEFLGWSESSSATTATYADGETITVSDDMTLYAVWENTFYSITTMQEMTSDICAVATTPAKTATQTDTTGEYAGNTNYIPQRTLTDTRDGNTYTIRKMADGNCWMAQNLRAAGTTLAASESDNLTSDFTLPASSASGWGTDGNTVTRVYTSPASADAGALYTWYAATGGNNTKLSGAGTVSGSICPKGWQLPRSAGAKSFQNMITTVYGVTNVTGIRNWPISVPASGMMVSGSYTPTGGWGNNYNIHFTADAASTLNDYVMIGSSGRSEMQYSHPTAHVGFSVRCVAK